MQHGALLRGRQVDANATRERKRQQRLTRLLVTLGVPLAWFWYHEISGSPVRPGVPAIIRNSPELAILGLMLVLITGMMLIPLMASSRSPHTTLRPSDSTVRLADVVGADATRREAIDTLNLFLNHETFADEMGGSPRRGVLFAGAPGTGKTYLAKAIAAEAEVPFLFVSASEFQSHFYGMTNRKIRQFFKALRKAARAEGGAIGFIEEFDAIGMARSGMGGGMREGASGIVNELLVQMQSFDLPTGWDKLRSKMIDRVNLLLPPARALPRPKLKPANVLVFAATNRADGLDPALMRPGRFDRTIHFDLPPRADRIAIAAYYLAKKSHDPSVSAVGIADRTAGYSPVRIERLLDEALIVALRKGRKALDIEDLVEAQMITEIGLAQDVGYQPDERRRIAVHEAGHAVVAVLVGRDVRVASILRRSSSLGLVAHDDGEERHLRTPSELHDLIVVALAGRAAEIQEYGEASTGIASDLVAATNIAAQLIGLVGAGDSLLSLEAAEMHMTGNMAAKVLADERSRVQADDVLNRAADRSACMLLEHRVALLAVADALCEHDELTGNLVHEIVAEAVTTTR
ncbi:MAG: AAA family ATPase [Actinomycetota bacterium]|nr:AAA family ATPase [Actinomycetota bacterium]